MRHPSRRTVVTGSVAVLALGAWPARAETTTITLLLTSDYDRLDEANGVDGQARGGLARLAAAVKSERQRNAATLLLHAGDAIPPSVLSSLDDGAHVIDVMNAIGFDAMVPGNHEFDYGLDAFQKRVAEARFPFIGANIRDGSGKPLRGLADYIEKEVGGVRLAVVGIASEATGTKSRAGDLVFGPSEATFARVAAERRAAGADLIVLLAHTDRSADSKLLDTRAAEIIFSGDDHELVLQYDGRSVFAESKTDGDYVVAIDLVINTAGQARERRISFVPRFRIIDTASVTPDQGIASRILTYQASLSLELEATVGTTQSDLDTREAVVRTRETVFGNLLADALRATTGADAALVNGGIIRGGRFYRAGTVLRYRDIVTELPYPNRVVLVELDGTHVRAALENGLSRYEDGSGRFPVISGLMVEADMTRPPGQRVLQLAYDGAPLAPDRKLKIATTDFMLMGGDGYKMLGEGTVLVDDKTGRTVAQQVIAHLRAAAAIAPAIDGRLKLKLG